MGAGWGMFFKVLLDPFHELQQVVPEVTGRFGLVGVFGVAGLGVAVVNVEVPGQPVALAVFLDDVEVVLGQKGLVPGVNGYGGRPFDGIVAFLDEAEGVVVEAPPNVEAMFFNAGVVGQITAAGSFTAQPPAHLVKSDGVVFLPVGAVG